MHLDTAAAEEAFREEVQDFLAEKLSDDLRQAGRRTTGICSPHEASQAWQKILHAKGWAAPGWPVEHGGTGWSPMRRHIFGTECHLAEAPLLAPMGLDMVGPAIMGYGGAEQKAFYLPRILAAEDSWCQGYSEPGSGSDLASLQCRAAREGRDYIINGAKIWTTHAQYADRMFCLVRTKHEGRPQEGISFILLEMDTPGITVEPIITLAGNHEVNQVFFDNVRVGRDNLVGAENEGWTVAKYLLEFERGAAAQSAALRVHLEAIRVLAEGRRNGDGQSLRADPAFAKALAALDIELTTLEYTEHRTMAEMVKRGHPGPASSLLKTRGTEVQMAVSELALRAIAYYSSPHQPEERLAGANLPPIGERDEMSVTARYLNDRAASIYGGSNEIQRNIMAKLVLGL